MSKLLDIYSRASGLEIGKPDIRTVGVALPFEKYITIHNSSGQTAKNYEYWSDTIRLIFAQLEERGIEVVQIGTKGDLPVLHAHNLCGQTSINQTAFLIKNSLCHLSNDSFSAHMAASFGTTQVELFGSTSMKNHGPHENWLTNPNSIFIESTRNGNLPSYQSFESPKTINLIKPENVAQAILKAMCIDAEINIETLWIGPKYGQGLFEFDNSFVMNPSVYSDLSFNLWFDRNPDEEILFKNLLGRSFYIITDRVISDGIFNKSLSKNIKVLAVELKKENCNEVLTFVKKLAKSNLNYIIPCYESSDWIDSQRIRFSDFAIIQQEKKFSLGSVTDEQKDLLKVATHFRTSKFLLTKAGLTLSKSHKNANIIVESGDSTDNEAQIIDDPLFWADAESQWIYKKTK